MNMAAITKVTVGNNWSPEDNCRRLPSILDKQCLSLQSFQRQNLLVFLRWSCFSLCRGYNMARLMGPMHSPFNWCLVASCYNCQWYTWLPSATRVPTRIVIMLATITKETLGIVGLSAQDWSTWVKFQHPLTYMLFAWLRLDELNLWGSNRNNLTIRDSFQSS